VAASSAIIATPIGPLKLDTNGIALTGVWFHAKGGLTEGRITGILGDTRRQLDEYFERKRTVFELPLAPSGTAFQLECWRALQEIPYGSTWTYAELASRIGRPDAVRAVGSANGANPIPIIIPCHRVIGSNGKLVGFGGGIETKQRLLELEGARLF
jgi:methylated-DNA-[protein]-cysteine S-methyltransferase